MVATPPVAGRTSIAPRESPSAAVRGVPGSKASKRTRSTTQPRLGGGGAGRRRWAGGGGGGGRPGRGAGRVGRREAAGAVGEGGATAGEGGRRRLGGARAADPHRPARPSAVDGEGLGRQIAVDGDD